MEQNIKTNQEYYKKLKSIQKKMNNVKADQSPKVIKYLIRRKSVDEIQIPLHDVEYNVQPEKKQQLFFKNFQQVTIDPNIKLDEINEEKWTIMTNNYKSLIEKSRLSLSKHNNENTQNVFHNRQPRKMQFITRRQSIEYRLREITTTSSNHVSVSPLKLTTQSNVQQSDPTYARFKKYYQRIGIPSESPMKQRLQKMMSTTTMITQKKRDKSSHQIYSLNQSTPISNNIMNIKTNNPIQYLKEIKEICSIASNYHAQVKLDEKNQIQHASQQVEQIQAKFNKFHKMLTSDLEIVDFLDNNQ